MALIPALTFYAVSIDGTTSTIVDSTVYGSPNALRADVAVYLTAYKVDESGVETAIPVQSFDPEVASSFIVTNNIDGRYKFYFMIAPRWLIGTTYNQYDVVWSETENKFYKYINVTSSAGNLVTSSFFEAVTDPNYIMWDSVTYNDPMNITFQVVEKIIDYQTAKCYATAVMKNAEENCGDGGDCGCGSKLGKTVAKLHTLLTVMRVADVRQQYLKGERFARTAEKYCDDCGCLSQ